MIHSFHGSHTYRWIRWETCPVINVYKVPGGQVHKCESYTETKPAGIKIEIKNFFSPFPPLSHEHPKWGFPGHRDGKRCNNSWPSRVHWMPPFNCSTLHITLFFFFKSLTTLEGWWVFTKFGNYTKLWVGWAGKRKRKKKKIQFHVPSWNNRLTSEHFQMKIFFPIIFDVAYWTSLRRLKLQRKMSYKEEKMTYSHHKIEQKKYP